MKHLNFHITELSRSEVLELKPTVQILVYNPFTKLYRIEFADEKCIARNKFSSSAIRYFLFTLNELPGG
ncbi:MAG: hypothetical protein IJW38_00740 [Clostridia bacterium]|nr:hypothetical protein [Clostridia bacterium]